MGDAPLDSSTPDDDTSPASGSAVKPGASPHPAPLGRALLDGVRHLVQALVVATVTVVVTVVYLQFLKPVETFIGDSVPTQLGGRTPAAFAFTVGVLVLSGVGVGFALRRIGQIDHVQFGFDKGELSGEEGVKLGPALAATGTSVIGLVAGVPLGPEAGLIGMLAGIAFWLGGKFRAPSTKVVPIGLSVGALTLVVVVGSHHSSAPLAGTSFTWQELLWAVPFGIAGGVVGVLTVTFGLVLRRMLRPWFTKPVLRCAVVAGVIGVIGFFAPLTLFSGEYDFETIVHDAATLGAVVLAVVALVRAFTVGLALASGFIGGTIFPLLFAGACIGISGSLGFVHGTHLTTAAAAGAVGASVVVLRKPVLLALLAALLLGLEQLPVMIVAAFVVAALTDGFANWAGIGTEPSTEVVDSGTAAADPGAAVPG